MPMRRTIAVPVIGGLVFGALSFLITVADITVRISEDLILGPWEILNTLSAALFGPIGLFITELGLDISGYLYLIRGVFPAPHDAYFMVSDYLAHTAAMLLVAIGYRFLYPRLRMPLFLAGWIPLMGLYYLAHPFLQVTLGNIAVPTLDASYAVWYRNVRLEFVLVTLITSLVLLALPERYRRPQWVEPVLAPPQSGAAHD